MPNPIALEIFGFKLRWYGVLISLGILLGVLIALRRGAKKNVIADDLLDVLIVGIPCAIIGARLYYVIFNLGYYTNHPNEIIAIWEGGLAIHGGLIAAILGGYITCKVKKLDFLKILDIFAPCFPLGQAIGRWGNYFNQEAYGGETTLPWAITVMDPVKGSIQVHPTFLYESIWNTLLFGFILFYEKRFKKAEGELICIYAIFYSVGRFFIEGLRTDSLYFMGFRTAQLISIVFVVIGSVILVKLRKKAVEL
ncbi:prolipoprotein diacylglyceryl transferase [Alkalibaculum sp. M08DMB]|uniref:Phosphatidylglycerol--prolipoprotein diacylglyceryl transferase n=1 Tax=Alkalibaculum sporogenes TaxID=2655001 RepID=A0A6A7K756_9FIRM|nr:prolipoprotein diacylglyceryl transferase [Alkalibaculum sporogenes]MPW25171.1 prolipoprotein diacylglyceryl transferase [Alkalibaculum sporogenes]